MHGTEDFPSPVERLREVEGYLADTAEGPLGVVDEVLPLDGEPATLVVCPGSLRQPRLLIPVEDIEVLEASTRRIVVRRSSAWESEERVGRRFLVGGLRGRLLRRRGRRAARRPHAA